MSKFVKSIEALEAELATAIRPVFRRGETPMWESEYCTALVDAVEPILTPMTLVDALVLQQLAISRRSAISLTTGEDYESIEHTAWDAAENLCVNLFMTQSAQSGADVHARADFLYGDCFGDRNGGSLPCYASAIMAAHRADLTRMKFEPRPAPQLRAVEAAL